MKVNALRKKVFSLSEKQTPDSLTPQSKGKFLPHCSSWWKQYWLAYVECFQRVRKQNSQKRAIDNMKQWVSPPSFISGRPSGLHIWTDTHSSVLLSLESDPWPWASPPHCTLIWTLFEFQPSVLPLHIRVTYLTIYMARENHKTLLSGHILFSDYILSEKTVSCLSPSLFSANELSSSQQF